MKNFMPLILQYFLFCLAPLQVSAEAYTWKQTNGPLGATVSTMLTHPTDDNIIYLATGARSPAAVTENITFILSKPNGGIFKSIDGGETWFPINQGLASRNVSGLAFHPHNPDILYTSTFNGVFKSEDRGMHWAELPGIGLNADRRINNITIDPHNPRILYALSPYPIGPLLDPTPPITSVLYRSDDGGVHWQLLFYESDDDGETYRLVPATENTYGLVLRGLLYTPGITFLPTDPSGVHYLTNGQYILGALKTADGGLTLTRLEQPLTLTVSHPNHPGLLYSLLNSDGTLSRSTDGGQTTALIESNQNFPDLRVSSILIHPLEPETLYVAAHPYGILRSTDSGASWQAINTGISSFAPKTYHYLLGISAHGKYMYAALPAQGKLFRSLNGGKSWIETNTGLIATTVSNLAVDSENPNTAYVLDGHRPLKTIDGGDTWNVMEVSTETSNISALTTDPHSPKTLYASSSQYDSLTQTTDSQLFESADNGITWSVLNTGSYWRLRSLHISPHGLDTFFSIMLSSYIYISTDSGENWEYLPERIPPESPSIVSFSAASFAFDPIQPKTLYAGTKFGGIYKTTDSGRNWRPIFTGLEDTMLFHDNGNPKGMEPVHGLTSDPLNPLTLYAGVANHGLYKSVNSGESWFPVPTPAPVANISALAISNQTLYVGTIGTGVFRVEISDTADSTAFFHEKTGKLVLPIVNTWLSDNLSVTLNLIDPDQLIFEIAAFGPTGLTEDATAYFDATHGTLLIPRVQILDAHYSVEMQLRGLNSGALQFRVSQIELRLD